MGASPFNLTVPGAHTCLHFPLLFLCRSQRQGQSATLNCVVVDGTRHITVVNWLAGSHFNLYNANEAVLQQQELYVRQQWIHAAQSNLYVVWLSSSPNHSGKFARLESAAFLHTNLCRFYAWWFGKWHYLKNSLCVARFWIRLMSSAARFSLLGGPLAQVYLVQQTTYGSPQNMCQIWYVLLASDKGYHVKRNDA